MRRTRVLLAVAAAATAAVVTGCGGSGGGGEAADSSPPASSSSSSPGSVAPTVGTTTKTTPPVSQPTATHIDTSLTGTAVRGVEPDCVGIKTAKGKTYQLAGDEARELAKSGGEGQELGKIKVSGHFAPKGAASTCMMGDIFVAVKVRKL